MSFFNARTSILPGVSLVCVLLYAAAAASAADPPARVARISVVSGVVSFHPAPAANWAAATLNYPMSTGDELWTDAGGRAELQFGSAVARLAGNTSVGILGLEGHIAQFRLPAGSLIVNISDLAPDDAVEVDMPNSAVSLLVPGTYRFDVDADGDKSTLTVRRGQANLATETTAFDVNESEAATVTGLTAAGVSRTPAAAVDEWEDWSASRDRRTIGAMARMFVSPQVIGYEDLDEFGTWDNDAQSRPIWIPHVAADWAPYRAGHWSWAEPWGWTWIDDAAWGFAPFHYGRWTMWDGHWAWAPGDLYARPIYAPALAAFVGDTSRDSRSATTTPIAWFPLGPRDMFEPAYQASTGYVRAINAAQIPLNAAVPADAYPNRSVPGALTAVTVGTFVHTQPVEAAQIKPTAPAGDMPVIGTAPHVAPEAASVIAADAHVAMPPGSVLSRQVIARTLPPPAPVSFAARQRALDQQPGRPLDQSAVESLRPVGTGGKSEHPGVRVIVTGESKDVRK